MLLIKNSVIHKQSRKKMMLIFVIAAAFPCNTIGKGSEENATTTPGAKEIIKYEAMLVADILGNYSKNMRPVVSSKMPAIIRFALQLNKLVTLKMKEQVLVIDSFILMEWEDPQLRWDPKKYNGTDIVVLKNTDVWTPDIVLYNQAELSGKPYLQSYNAPIIARNHGTVQWSNGITLKASCDVDITWFPFDNQVCTLKFGSWSLTVSRLQLQFMRDQLDKQSLIDEGNIHIRSGIWSIVEFNSSLKPVKFSCCVEPFSEIRYTFKLRRLPQFFLLYLIFPCAAIIGLALVSFVIPPDGGERVGFGVTVILSFSVYLIVISDKLPEKSNKASLLGILFVTVFYILVASFILSTINVRLSSNTHPPPMWLLKMVERWGCTRYTSCKNRCICVREKRCLEEQEMDQKRDDFVDCISVQANTTNDCDTKDDETFKKQWKLIALHLDKVFFKFIVFIIFLLPVLIVLSINSK